MTVASQRTMMPAVVYAKAKRLAPSRGHNAGAQYDAAGRYRAADKYTWGGRLQDIRMYGKEAKRTSRAVGTDASGAALNNPAWTASRWHGMVKMSGGARHNAYLTFRIITPQSKGWRIPARAGHHIAARLSQDIESGQLGAEIARMVDAEIAAALQQATGAP